MKKTILLLLVTTLLSNCQQSQKNTPTKPNAPTENLISKPIQTTQPPDLQYSWLDIFDYKKSILHQIPTPQNYNRVSTKDHSFQQWLQFLPLFPEGQKVKTYDGKLKWNQNIHTRVLDIDIGKRDLQQCADAVMRLRAEYFFGKKEYQKIHFKYTNGTNVTFENWRKGKRPVVHGNRVTFSSSGQNDSSYSSFKKYLIQIFSYAGTASLEKEMQSIQLADMQIGDVFIQGGHPGHAVIIVDMAEHSSGEKVYLLAQSYMPAQNIHILKNPMNADFSPWYQLIPNQPIQTPEWNFTPNDLKRFVE